MSRWAWAEVDLDALAHNVAVLRSRVHPSEVWAVVKANGYGHGAEAVSRAALDAGARGLCVALVDEGVALRHAGIDAPILVLSEQPPDQVDPLVEHSLTPMAYTEPYLDALAAAAARRGTSVEVHLKVDTGMQRVGADPARLVDLVSAVRAHGSLRLGGIASHLAVADEPGDAMTAAQLQRFDHGLGQLRAAFGDEVLDSVALHVANSAGALAHPATRRSFVRAGIAMYGITPGAGVAHLCEELVPVLRWCARVSFVKRVRAGSRISYGLRHTFDRDTTVATVPIGYADGVARRAYDAGVEVLVGGRRRRIVGVVTMDQLMVDVGGDEVAVGDEVVLVGAQGDECIRAEEWAARLGTIGYEIVCAVSTRVPRVLRRSIGT